MRLATIAFLLLAWPAAALAIQPQDAGDLPAKSEPKALGADDSVPERIRRRREMQEEYRAKTAERQERIRAASEEFAPQPAGTVPGWKADAARVTTLSPDGDDSNPLRLGPWVLGFAAAAAVLVLLLKMPSGWLLFWRRSGADDDEAPRRRLADGPQTVTLRPRETRWSKDPTRG